MSGRAVIRRLRQVDELRELGLKLMKAKKAHDDKEKEQLQDPETVDSELKPENLA